MRLFELCLERKVLDPPLKIISMMYKHKEKIKFQNMPKKWSELSDVISSVYGLDRGLEVMDRMAAFGLKGTEVAPAYAQILR